MTENKEELNSKILIASESIKQDARKNNNGRNSFLLISLNMLSFTQEKNITNFRRRASVNDNKVTRKTKECTKIHSEILKI